MPARNSKADEYIRTRNNTAAFTYIVPKGGAYYGAANTPPIPIPIPILE